MGRKRGLYINPKQLQRAGSMQKPCMKEMVTFLNCLALNQNNDEKCVKQKGLLDACMDAQAGKKKKGAWGSVNYHISRLSRGGK